LSVRSRTIRLGVCLQALQPTACAQQDIPAQRLSVRSILAVAEPLYFLPRYFVHDRHDAALSLDFDDANDASFFIRDFGMDDVLPWTMA